LDRTHASAKAEFLRGMLHLDRNEWIEAAKSFGIAEVPDSETTVVQTVIALAPLRAGSEPAEKTSFAEPRSIADGDARALIILARMAIFRGLPDVAEEASQAAVAALNSESSMSERGMLAAYASEADDNELVIEVLDGYVPESFISRELLSLAQAHARERPKRERNLRFFDRLPRDIRDRPEYARSRASVLLDAGKLDDAERIFRSIIRAKPNDVYSHLRLIEALVRLNRKPQIAPVAIAVDEFTLEGPPEYLMAFAHALRDAGASDRALNFAYDLVRRYFGNPKVALGYVSLVLGSREQRMIPDVTAAADGAWVRLQSPANEEHRFAIDDGGQFLGIESLPPNDDLAKLVTGLKVGETFEIDKGPFPAQTWTLVEVKSKFLHLLHVIMAEFERRYPGVNGLWRVDIKDQNLEAVFDFIRKKAEADRETANAYIEKGLPLAFVARMLGGEPTGFAQFVRSLGADIITCQGNEEERAAAYALAIKARGNGVTLDQYTVWTAAEMGILDILKLWFGKLLISASTISSIDKLIRREEESLGQKTMSIAWREGQFIRIETTDEFVQQQIAALQKLKDDLSAHCEIEHTLVPDELPALAIQIVAQFGSHLLDPMFIAKSHKTILLSDDLRYRQLALEINGTGGLWLQAVLACVLGGKVVERKRGIDAYVHLAARRHSHINLNADILREVYEGCADEDLRDFDVITEFIGNKNAEMNSHSMVTARLLAGLWATFRGDLKCQRATGIIVGKLIRFRTQDWGFWFASLFFGSDQALDRYLETWLRGYFLPVASVAAGFHQWRGFIARAQPRSFGPISTLALKKGGSI
jgi:cellulose synthase operon protein C